MFQEKNLTRFELSIGNYKSTWETPFTDCDMEDLINAFYGMCITMTWSPATVLHAMKDFAEEHLPYVDAEYSAEK